MNPKDYIDVSKDLRRVLGGQGIGKIALIVLLVLVLYGCWFQIGPESRGVVLRLGKHVRTVGPGLHLKWPLGIEEVYKVAAERQLKEEFGFRTEEAGIRTRYASRDYLEESLMLTGDLNVAVVEWTVQYRIADPYRFLFKVRDVRETFRYMSQAVMREIVGDRTVNEVLTVGRTELAVTVQERLQELADQYETGIKVDQVILQDVTPPDAVKPSFNEVNQAQQEMERMINEAKAEYNSIIPKAKGEADQMIRQAEGYAVDRTNRAEGEAARFRQLHAAYRQAPEVTRRRIYIETLGEVLPKVGRKLIVDQGTQNIIPLLQLGREGQNQ